MVEIKSASLGSPQSERILELLRSKWPDIGEFESASFGVKLPNPLGAYKNAELVGGLSYCAYKSPDKNEFDLWINTVFVNYVNRRQGIATALVKCAQKQSPCIYALTQFPGLYFNLGFKAVAESPEGVVVKYSKI